MDLYCCETENITRAYEDPVLNEDSRVFDNLLVIEDRYVLSSNYFKCVQNDLKPYMRTVVAEWMQEVNNIYISILQLTYRFCNLHIYFAM